MPALEGEPASLRQGHRAGGFERQIHAVWHPAGTYRPPAS